MFPIDLSALPPSSSAALVARSSDSAPEFLLADRPVPVSRSGSATSFAPRFVTARWRRRTVRLDQPMRLEQHLLSYCERGGAGTMVVLDGVPMQAWQRTGTVSLLPAGRCVCWMRDAPAEVVHLHLYIADETLRDALPADEDGAPLGLAALVNVHDRWLVSFFQLLLAEYEACRCRGRLHEFDLIDHLGDRLLRRLATLQRDAGHRPSVVTPLRPHLLREVQAHVEKHLGGHITLGQLAALASLSVDHFVRVFAQATGTTPHRWLLERRLDAACARLSGSSDRIEAIARDCGFSGTAHFSAAFRRRHGLTPSAYRRTDRPRL